MHKTLRVLSHFRILDVLYIITAIFISALTTACSDRFSADSARSEEISVTFRIPSFQDFNSRSLSSGEQTINSLDVFLFHSIYGSVYKKIDLACLTPNKSGNYDEYTVTSIRSGEYFVYAAANISDYLEDKTKELLDSENLTYENFENIILNFNAIQLTADNLPRVCLSPIYNDDETVRTLKITSGTGSSITLPLKFLCSKVRYTILFNAGEDGFSSGFENRSFDIPEDSENPFVSNIIANTEIKTGDSPCNSILTREDNVPENWNFPFAKYVYPEEENYPYINNENNLSESQSNFLPDLSEVWGSNSDPKKFAWQGNVYLPENLSETYSTINVTARVGNEETEHISFIKRTENGSEKGIGRGEMFDIVTKVTGYTPSAWETIISVRDWDEINLPLELIHTYLTLSQTEGITVSSGKDAIISFSTDGRSPVTVESELQIDGKPVITGYPSKDETGNDILVIGLNNAISINRFSAGELNGKEIDCYVKAGNIKKLIKVSYSVSPFLSVTPRTLRFYEGDEEISQRIDVSTNLGGIKIYKSNEKGEKGEEITSNFPDDSGYVLETLKDYLNKDGESKSTSSVVILNCTETTLSNIELSVPDVTYGTRAIHHYLLLEGAEEYEGNSFKELVDIITYPSSFEHRIYFRAVNDFVSENGKGIYEFLDNDYNKYPYEEFFPWYDMWSASPDSPSPTNHLISINSYPFESMTGDGFNPGWYFYEPDPTELSDNGENYLYFSSSGASGDWLHRAPHADIAAGIPFIELQDKEVWYLYDPTNSPYYSIWDEKPEIEDVTYTVYTDSPVNNWHISYGATDDSNPGYTIQYNFGTPSKGNDSETGKCIQLSENNYVTRFLLKAPSINHSKSIYLNILQESEPESTPCIYLLVNHLSNDPFVEFKYQIPKIEYLDLWYFPISDESGQHKFEMQQCGVMDVYPIYRNKIVGNPSYFEITIDYKYINTASNKKYLIPFTKGNVLYHLDELEKSSIPYYDYTPDSEPKTIDLLLFDGHSFPDDTGTFKEGIWFQGKN